MTPIRDLEHRFNVAGRNYALQVCGCGHHPAPASAGPFDVMLVECVPEDLLDHEDDSPDKIVRNVVAHAKRFMPDAITPTSGTNLPWLLMTGFASIEPLHRFAITSSRPSRDARR